jgi:quercetin dioxygenase-like cupin family protein
MGAKDSPMRRSVIRVVHSGVTGAEFSNRQNAESTYPSKHVQVGENCAARTSAVSLGQPNKGGLLFMANPATQPARRDPVQVDPKHYTVELENEKVRVLRIRYGPGEKSVMHAHPAIVGVMLTDGHIGFTYPDGRTEEINAKAGQVLNFPALEHLPENLGKRPFEVIAVELKG